MKISEFATQNDVSAKMLRHYDAIGLLKPDLIDPFTGYRQYSPAQTKAVSWIRNIIYQRLFEGLKNLITKPSLRISF